MGTPLWTKASKVLKLLAAVARGLERGESGSADQARDLVHSQALETWLHRSAGTDAQILLGARFDKSFGKALQKFTDTIGPAQFTYKNFKIMNPGRMTDSRIRRALDGIDYLAALFRKKGMARLLTTGVRSVRLSDEVSDWDGQYSAGGFIRLSWAALARGSI